MIEAVILCALLGSPSFTVRQNADTCLRAMGQLAAPILFLHTDSRDPEIRQRATSILRERKPIDATTVLLACHQPLPIIWAMPDAITDRDNVIAHCWSQAHDRCKNNDWADSEATDVWIRKMGEAGVPVDVLDLILKRMKQRMAGRPNAWWADIPPEPCERVDRAILGVARWLRTITTRCPFWETGNRWTDPDD